MKEAIGLARVGTEAHAEGVAERRSRRRVR